ncbi:flagellar biosynthetic protein FliR [uncultured Sphingomonas sp.]|uniref:flagellar biosynthetic protein FliR n=1 Tax=uncultured Sphingomonas sp. TaxID=158754 RepID=UPI0025FFF388|nr:flagellar biosynthetic protein FliR [uncultured Sphingomonas sp.]
MTPFLSQAIAVLLVSLRIGPTLAFAPPFTLLRVPAAVRMMLGVALAAWLVAGNPASTWQVRSSGVALLVIALSELMLGVALALALQLAFAALLVAGRVVDIQAGFGLAALADPTTKAQMPVVGTFFAYATAAIFFATDGPRTLLAIWSASIERTPLGSATMGTDPARMIGYCSTVFLLALGVAGLLILVLFVIDLAIAFMSRTLPQMNVLLLGFQVKTLALLVTLPIAMALAAASMLHVVSYALETMPELG